MFAITLFLLAVNPTLLRATSDQSSPLITSVWHSPQHPTQKDTVKVYATVEDVESGIKEVLLYYSIGGPYSKVQMSDLENGTFLGYIPPQKEGTRVKYFVLACDNANNTSFSQVYSYVVCDTSPPQILEVVLAPRVPSYEDSVRVYTKVFDGASEIGSTFLYYKMGEGSWLRVPMKALNATWFCGDIPPQPYNTTVYYYVEAVDKAGNVAASEIRNYTVVDEKPPLVKKVSYPLKAKVGGSLVVSVEAFDGGSGVASVALYWRLEYEEAWHEEAGVRTEDGSWKFEISLKRPSRKLYFYLVVTDVSGNDVKTRPYEVSLTNEFSILEHLNEISLSLLVVFSFGLFISALFYKTGYLKSSYSNYMLELEKLEQKYELEVLKSLEEFGFSPNLKANE